VAELAYDEQPFFVDNGPNTFRFRIELEHAMWHKENLVNLAAQAVPSNYDVLAWVDPDIYFMSQDWVTEARRALCDAGVVQLFSEALWTDQDGRATVRKRSTLADGFLRSGVNHPGFAWAARRGLWEQGGGLCDLAVVGGGDALFACACLDDTLPGWLNYPSWRDWTASSRNWIQHNGGCRAIAGTVVHEWHGPDEARAYVTRHALIAGIDVQSILVRRSDGLLSFAPTVPPDFRSALLQYFNHRSEDGRAAG